MNNRPQLTENLLHSMLTESIFETYFVIPKALVKFSVWEVINCSVKSYSSFSGT